MNIQTFNFTKGQLKRLENALPDDGKKRICDKFNFTIQYCNRCFSDFTKTKRLDVIEYAIELAEEEKVRIQELGKRIKNLI